MKFGDFVQERLFKPLGMNDTHFFVPDDKMDRVTALYFKVDGKLIKAEEGKIYKGAEYGISEQVDPFWFRASKNPQKYFAAGEGLVSTIEDYARFLQMLVNGGEFNGVRILSRKTIEFMTANHIKDLDCCIQIFGPPLAGYGWGMGLAVLKDNGTGHHIGTPLGKGRGGQFTWSGWMGTLQYVDPEEELFMMVMSQKLPWPQPWKEKFKDLVYQAIID
jgi:CubicO group peptidase (beta-lactamase class C family)